MNNLDRFLKSLGHDLDYASKHQAMLGFLYSTVRSYNKTCEELERLKDFTGFNKPFPILRLPREIRDEIYTYSLCAAKPIETRLHTVFSLTAQDSPFKPPTSSLLYTNKQIYHEAIEILYSKNILRFDEPQQLLAFDEQIGPENRKRVREMCIWTRFPQSDEVILDPECLPPSEYDSIPSHWIAALKACRFEKIVHLRVEAEMLFTDPSYLLSMPADLLEFIKEFLGSLANDETPRLSLKGFREQEREKFPEWWEVVMDQWDCYNDESRALQLEMEEYRDTHGELGVEGFQSEDEGFQSEDEGFQSEDEGFQPEDEGFQSEDEGFQWENEVHNLLEGFND